MMLSGTPGSSIFNALFIRNNNTIIMIYVLTEWSGKGSEDVTLITRSKKEAMFSRECTLTVAGAKKKYGPDYFRNVNDVKSSTIDKYKQDKDIGVHDPVATWNWY